LNALSGQNFVDPENLLPQLPFDRARQNFFSADIFDELERPKHPAGLPAENLQKIRWLLIHRD
jgi:hypothetical protein